MFEKVFRIFDIYGSPFNLRINGQSKFKSATGGFFSIITFAVLMITIIYFGKNFYRRQNPKLTVEEGLYQNLEMPILDGSDYESKFLVISFEKKIDSIIKFFSLRSLFDSNNEEIGSEQIFTKDCSTEYLLNKSIISKENDIYHSNYAFKCIRLNDFKIGGMSSENNKPLIISTQKCSEIDKLSLVNYNLTHCDMTFNETIDFMPINIWYEKIGFSPNSPFPFTKKIIPTAHFLSKEKNNYLYFPISVYHLNDDLGWIFNSTETLFTFNFMNYNFVQYPSVGQDASYPQLSLVIYVSDDYKVFTRTYEKIQDLLAVIGGFMKIVFALLNILNLLIRAYLMDNYMVGRIFDQGETVSASHYKILAGIQTNTCVKGVNSVLNKINLDPQINSRQDKSINSRLFLSSSKTGK